MKNGHHSVSYEERIGCPVPLLQKQETMLPHAKLGSGIISDFLCWTIPDLTVRRNLT
jgi:hypothetical protein